MRALTPRKKFPKRTASDFPLSFYSQKPPSVLNRWRFSDSGLNAVQAILARSAEGADNLSQSGRQIIGRSGEQSILPTGEAEPPPHGSRKELQVLLRALLRCCGKDNYWCGN